MLIQILGITDSNNNKKYIAAAFPSACGKTNLAMLESSLPEYKIECVGDDIAWMKFDENGTLRAINPEYGFFGVAPGTSYKTNPHAMRCIQKNSIFTNVAETSDGGFFWEGMEKEVDLDTVEITDWHGNKWDKVMNFNRLLQSKPIDNVHTISNTIIRYPINMALASPISITALMVPPHIIYFLDNAHTIFIQL